jgi:hypothetical protein
MSLARLKQLQKNTENLIISFENTNIIGPISYLEEISDLIEHAIDEYKMTYDVAEEED